MIETLLDEIDGAVNAGLYFVGLFSALSIPDICGAIESPDGQATGQKYVAWFDAWVAARYLIGGAPSLTGTTCYYYRCAALHQARAQHPNLGYARILFVEPAGGAVIHNNILGNALNIDVRVFCSDIVNGARAWLLHVADSNDFQANIAQSMQRYPNGLAPYIVGFPVIA